MTGTRAFDIDPLLQMMWDQGGSDLLLTGGSEPRIRVNGALRPVGESLLEGQAIALVVDAMLNPEQRQRFIVDKDIDFAFSWKEHGRLRANAFVQRGTVALELRMVPYKIPTMAELGLPPVAGWLADLPRGLVLVTGPTGSGKSTTLASIVDHINENREVHILTVEDPIEYLHQHKRSVVNQRAVGTDTPSFERALRAALREDPDVLLIGEMRDLESIQIALTMAETGHLVFATLHTNDAAQAVDRIIDVFPGGRQDQIRVQLGASLAAVLAQRLVPRTAGGMVAAFEVLVATNATRNLIREGKTNQLRNIMSTNQNERMLTLEMTLNELIRSEVISYETALGICNVPKEIIGRPTTLSAAPTRRR
ncbi:MAG TPA: type IV pilus twitching motility protein PilT [Acidimicrobiales bacterium]|nr:type IV pilus twitching motility protein PilT [Acidimicrobiales bacterium]